jgi:hypothetical protein
MSNKREFLIELKSLLKKYNAEINFSCSDSSDTFGLKNDTIQIKLNEKVILETGHWHLTQNNIKIK